MSDDVSMGALSGSIAERTRQSLAAGCDLVLHCNGDLAEMQEVAADCPELAGAALERTERALGARRRARRHRYRARRGREFAELVAGDDRTPAP